MSPKQRHEEQPPDQGQLFSVEASRTHPPIIGEVVGGGVYPEDLTPTEESVDTRHFHEAVHETVIKEQQARNRRLGNAGKHSPLTRDGHYERIQLGDFLPGFGPVKERNWEEAKAFAAGLETKRQAEFGSQPDLFSKRKEAVAAEVGRVADVLSDLERPIIKKEPELADTQIKLEALRDDTRAGFLPTTHREKSQAFELLDYMDTQKYPEGVSTRLKEIFYRQQREMKLSGSMPYEAHEIAKKSVQSVVHEWGDYYNNARNSWRKLHALSRLINDSPNPNLSLSQLLEDAAQGEVVTQLVRYMCLRDIRDSDKMLGFDPLWTREDREAPTGTKNKTVEDMFTHQNERFMAAYIARYAQRTTIKQIRGLVTEALHDQEARGQFWKKSLTSLDEDFKPYAEQALSEAS